jgi:choline dehydrogenase-like flavoprotein
MPDTPLTPQERRLQVLLKILAVVFALAAFGYLLPALVGPSKAFFIQLPFVTNSAVKVSVLALLAWLAAGNVRRFRPMTELVIVGHVISELAVFATLLWGNAGELVGLVNPLTGALMIFPIATALWASVILDGVVLVLLVWFYLAAEQARYGLSYLSPMQFRALVALSEALIYGKDEQLPPADIARNVDNYLAAFRARMKWLFKLVLTGMQLYPLLTLQPPLTVMRPADRRRFLERRFYTDLRLVPKFWRFLVKAMIRVAKQLAYLGYYNDARTFAAVGYVPFSRRPDTPDKLAQSPPPPRQPLRVYTPAEITTDTWRGDVVIIGSGAAASVLAHALVARNRDVLMLERGTYVDPSQMSEDEAAMLSKLYAEGALQLTRDFELQVLQGSCVGGTTVVNNAVAFDLPQDVLDRWNDPQLYDAGLDAEQLMASFARVRRLIRVQRQAHPHLNKGAQPVERGIKRLGLDQAPNVFDVVEANIEGCYGCGYCNIGCQFGKKLSMLDVVLPAAQQLRGPEALKIIAGCEAQKLHSNGTTVTKVTCRLHNGRRLEVYGNTIVLAAGAISSSILLLRSGAGGQQVGKHLAFNLGSPITAVFAEPINAYDGLQISHYLRLSPTRGYVLETWFNPPVAQALAMPGWFDDHYNNMRRYHRLAGVGVLVPSEANAQVRDAGVFRREIVYTPTPGDLATLVEGLILAGRIFFAGGAAITMPHTWDYYEFTQPDDLERLRQIIRKPGDVTLGTGHPQGGNRLSKNASQGVVNPEFQVFGYDNLYVCDASVFPSSIGVNPQLTVMALADYASQFIAEARGK